ncbi:MAG: haloacid dehalogenase-like hydrolase [Dehalococcoidia bacterium]|nr:haloacid dehalogenase-like hydrolase [Dehalococcoidia bacterium]
MPLKAVVSDWNGTLIAYPDESPMLMRIATDIFKSCVPYRPLKMAEILRTRRILRNLHAELDRDRQAVIRDMFRVYNERIIRGTPMRVIHDSMDRFCRSPDTQAKLEMRLIRPIRRWRESGMMTGIVSAGYRHGIEKALGFAGYRDYFDFCQAEDIKHNDGHAVEFGLEIYKKKHIHLARLLEDRNMDPRHAAYVGDTDDDESCFQVVGYPIVSFLAPGDVKERFARKYRAFVPESEEELDRYLEDKRAED